MVHEMYAMFEGKQLAETPLNSSRGKQIDFTTFIGYSGTQNSTKAIEWIVDNATMTHMSSNLKIFF